MARIQRNVFILFNLCVLYGQTISQITSVDTPAGTIVGAKENVRVAGEDYVTSRYLGIPYAQPPLGDLRFRKPLPRTKFDAPFHAIKFGPACPQYGIQGIVVSDNQSEDCLFLNVFVPNREPDSKDGHAVMVFIHGGGFILGSGDTYPSDTLAAYGNVIVVTINYRIGLLGFFTTKDEKAPGNYGLWDQHLALQWVNKNIGAFGGDNKRVTVFGQSAGSMSAVMQGIFPGNKGLIERVIAQSGSPLLSTFAAQNFTFATETIAEMFHCDQSNVDTLIACLRAVDAKKMIRKIESAGDDIETFLKITFFPTVDGEFFTDYPKDIFDDIKESPRLEVQFFRSLDIMVGISSHEGGIYVQSFSGTKDVDNFKPTRDEINTLLPTGVLLYFNRPGTNLVNKLVATEYTDWNNPDDPEKVRDQFAKFQGDIWFALPSIKIARDHTNSSLKGRSYFYNFTPRPTTRILKNTPTWLKGANHADELGFVFGFDSNILQVFRRQNEAVPDPSLWELDLSHQVMRYWTNFAKTGNPNGPNGTDLVWPEFDLRSQKAFEFRENTQGHVVKENVLAREANFWFDIVPEAFSLDDTEQIGSSYFGEKQDDACAAGGDCDGE